MLRITVNKSASAAKKYYSESYYSEGKSTQNYYSEKDQSIGTWGGKAAEKLNLTHAIDKNDFADLCDNLNPKNHEQLTERKNIERRVGYDFTFNASKSISLAYTFGNENDKKEILQAFKDSVKETMSEIETGMQTRVRQKGQNENRETGNIIYGEFTHFTSRPVDGIPDPHLHSHCFIFNATFDDKEQKWKAGEFGQIKKDAPYYESVFHATLAHKLQSMGYEIEKTQNGFELKGIARETIDKFSRRTTEIENLAAEKNITDDKMKSKLGALTREGKRESVPEQEQASNWNQRFTEGEKESIQALKKSGFAGEKKNDDFSIVSDAAVKYSLNHHLERKSVTTDKEILMTAIRHSIGESTPKAIKNAFEEQHDVIAVKEHHQTFVTTKDALQEEKNLIVNAFSTKGRFKPINENYTYKAEHLTAEQKTAITHALTSTDGITIISGKAGTGKTTLMKEVQQGIKESGKTLRAFAPSAEASRVVQRKEGFENAETLAALFHDKAMQNKLANGVLWVDEAGMLSNKDMNHVLKIAKEQQARIILTGDTKQHSSVERGDALRILQQEAGIITIQVSKIQRQKNEQYKQAVFYLSKDDVIKGFQKLEKAGAIHEVEDGKERIARIAEDYYTSSYSGYTSKSDKKPLKEILVISPTHAEGDQVTACIREKLKQANIINTDERKFVCFKNLQLTEAEKQKKENYEEGDYVIFHQHTKGFKAGCRYEVKGKGEDNSVLLYGNGKTVMFALGGKPAHHVYGTKEMYFSKGDKIRITGNGKTNDGKHLFNGSVFNVNGFDKHGNLKLSNGSVLSKEYGHFSLGYVMTSHASQGKTVDKVIISQSSMSFRASSKEQFYVSVSRGRQAVSIYTDDKTDLLHALSQSGERRSALELTKQKVILEHAIDVTRFGLMQKIKTSTLEKYNQIKNSYLKKGVNNELSRQNSPPNQGKER